MKKKKILIPVFVLLLLIIFGVYYYFYYAHSHSTGLIKVSGNIEATDIRLSFQVFGKLKQIFTDEGMFVKKNQLVAVLDKDELTKNKEHAQAILEDANSNYNWLKEEYERAENLYKGGATSSQQRDSAKAKYDASYAQLKAAKSSLELAAIQLAYADLNSPVNGFVLVKSAEPGEILQPGSVVFTVADLNDIWLTSYINETDLGKVKLNQPADVITDTYPDKIYKGRISFISEQAEFTPKQIQTTEERVKLVYRIKITVQNPNLELKPGMPADAYIKE